MPSEEILQNYNSSYFMTAHGGIPQDVVAQSFFSGIAGLRLKHIQNYLQKNRLRVSDVLEIGPGTGIFAKKWRSAYPGNNYYAVETDTSCYRSLEETGVIISKPEEIKGLDKEFDLVIMSHVLEHVTNPDEFIRDSTRCLKNGGIIFIEVPCNDWKHKPEDEPHLLFFHKKPMMLLMESLGFNNIQLSYHGQTIDKLMLKPSKWNLVSRFYGKIMQFGLFWLPSLFYRGDSANLSTIEKAVMLPFKAHKTSDNPAWWLRVLAQKV
jgi:SAM-dependent methyltransferase